MTSTRKEEEKIIDMMIVKIMKGFIKIPKKSKCLYIIEPSTAIRFRLCYSGEAKFFKLNYLSLWTMMS
jgi:hypothetical protein